MTFRLDTLVLEWRRHGDQETIGKLHIFLRNWLVEHTMKADMRFADYTKGKELQIREALQRLSETTALRP